METLEKKQFMEEFKTQWKNMWQNRVDDRTRAEGIADKDYSLLSVDRGTVIIATRNFKLLDFRELLQQNRSLLDNVIVPPNPSVGGWRKFAKTTSVSPNLIKRGRRIPPKPDRRSTKLQLKKSGRGWLHFRR